MANVCGVRGLSFDEPSPCWWRPRRRVQANAVLPRAQLTILDRRGCRPTLGKHRGNCDAPLDSYFGLKFCERLLYRVYRRAPRSSRLISTLSKRLCMYCPCLYYVSLYTVLPPALPKRLSKAIAISPAKKQKTRLCPAAVSRLRTHQASR